MHIYIHTGRGHHAGDKREAESLPAWIISYSTRRERGGGETERQRRGGGSGSAGMHRAVLLLSDVCLQLLRAVVARLGIVLASGVFDLLLLSLHHPLPVCIFSIQDESPQRKKNGRKRRWKLWWCS